MAKSRFKITDFINPSGATAYRVSGTLDGKTIRKNFKTREEAVAHRPVWCPILPLPYLQEFALTGNMGKLAG